MNNISRIEGSFAEEDLDDLVEVAASAILDGGILGWAYPPERRLLARYFEGLLLAPGREILVMRDDNGRICGAGLLVHASAHSELHSPRTSLAALFIAPYKRRQGLGRTLLLALLDRLYKRGTKVVDCEVRENQSAAYHLLCHLGFEHWGTHPYYARIDGRTIRGFYLSKLLAPEAEAPLWRSASSSPLSRQDPAMNTTSPFSPPHHSASGMAQSSLSPSGPQTGSSLVLYPAIDLKEGACVRLRQGEMGEATLYSDNPPAQARFFADSGCHYLHVVDLDGAFTGQSSNSEAVKAIIANTSLPLQLGGGLRDMRAIESWLEAGVSRVILGSIAVKDPELVRQAARAWPGRIIAGIDARQGRVATEGWAEISECTASDLARKMEDAGVAGIIFTEISRDGMLEGLDIDQTANLARQLSIPVIASGGVGSLAHLRALREVAQHVPGIKGVIVGRALYDGRFTLKEALAVIEGIEENEEGSPC